jgi:hypothetical protein
MSQPLRQYVWLIVSSPHILFHLEQVFFSDSSGKSVKVGAVQRNACRVEFEDDFDMFVVDDDLFDVTADEFLDFGNVSFSDEPSEFSEQLAQRFFCDGDFRFVELPFSDPNVQTRFFILQFGHLLDDGGLREALCDFTLFRLLK